MLAALIACTLTAQTPDFAGPLVTEKMGKRIGEQPVLVILWDPKRPTDPAPTRAAVEELMYGTRGRSVAGWYRENSGGRFRLKNAGVLGWYSAKKPGDHYWGSADTGDKDGDGFVGGHVEKWAEAVWKAAEEFDFKKYDKNRNQILEPSELGIIVVIPQNGPFGTMRTPAGREHPKWEPLVADGVQIPVITEAYAGAPPNLGLFAHELSHLFLGAPDMYQDVPFRPGRYSLMDSSYGTEHIDPFEKLKLGWLKYTAVSKAGDYRLRDVERSSEALIVYDSTRGPNEYFIVENRFRIGSYDDGLPMDGLAVWHVIEDPAVFDKLPPAGSPGDWGRRGVRLVRANGGSPVDDAKALFGKGAVCEPKWADGSPSGFKISLADDVGAEVTVRVER
jgi:M6 family metalloprotease-like protein